MKVYRTKADAAALNISTLTEVSLDEAVNQYYIEYAAEMWKKYRGEDIAVQEMVLYAFKNANEIVRYYRLSEVKNEDLEEARVRFFIWGFNEEQIDEDAKTMTLEDFRVRYCL